jgi:prepilin-type N-terminal cleavage/methylation domain-containing protein
MWHMANRRYDNGVTLLEMLVVLGVIMVLAGIAVTVTHRVDNQTKENALDNAFALLNGALREYYEVKGTFPLPDPNATAPLLRVEDVMQKLRAVPACRQVLDKLGGALVKSQAGRPEVIEPRDPWGTVLDYVYHPAVGVRTGDNFPELLSAGPDRQFGTADDISSKGRKLRP